ncbi:MAG: rhodanese-like domain-containing protein [Aquificaceae bacterium]|nr:MAG: rhodanese-like domain-containing protein [Aquificaceae bacterium]
MKTVIKYTATIALSSLLVACGSGAANKPTESSANPTSAQEVQKTGTSVMAPIPQSGGYSNIDNAQLEQMMKKGIPLIDIRLKEEWQQTGIVKGAKTITFFTRNGSINPNFVPEFKAITKADQPVALMCRTGNRTRAASQAIAQQLGYKKIYNVTHGITGWIAEKRPVVPYK